MIQVTYTSESAGAMASGDVFRIIEISAKNNAENGLSGFLIYLDGRFFQLLEGPEQAVDALLAKLAEDHRHTSIKIVTRDPLDERTFPNWKMKRLVPGRSRHSIVHDVPEFRFASSQVKRSLDEFLNPAGSEHA